MNASHMILRIYHYRIRKSVEFLSYDEYDSEGSGMYYSDDLLMCERYNFGEAEEMAKDGGHKIYLVTIEKYDGRVTTDVGEIQN